MKKKTNEGVFTAINTAARTHKLLTIGTILCVAASVGASLIPPLLLAKIIDRLTGGISLTFAVFRSGNSSRAVRSENDTRAPL